jgi:hypothetical protein
MSGRLLKKRKWKHCCDCKHLLQLEKFSRCRRSPDGRQYRCKLCQRALDSKRQSVPYEERIAKRKAARERFGRGARSQNGLVAKRSDFQMRRGSTA